MKVLSVGMAIALVVITPLIACGATVRFKRGQYCGSYKVSYDRVLELSARANQTLAVRGIDNIGGLEVTKNGVSANIEILEGLILSQLQEDGTYTVTPYPLNPAKPMVLEVCVFNEDRV